MEQFKHYKNMYCSNVNFFALDAIASAIVLPVYWILDSPLFSIVTLRAIAIRPMLFCVIRARGIEQRVYSSEL